MTILAPLAPARNANPIPSANPRDSWPEWTDGHCWELGPDSDSDSDDFRPTPDSDFTPTVEEEAEAAELLNGNGDDFDTRTDAEWEAMAEGAAAMEAICSGYAWL